MQIGLIGLQNSGKTTLFQTCTILSAGSDAGKSEQSRAMVRVPDNRLDELTKIFNPKKQVNATLELIDIPGLQLSDDGKIKISADFLTKVKNNDALLHIVREFSEGSVAHPEGSIDPLRDIEFLETEFLLTDLSMIERRIEKLTKDVLKNKSEQLIRELALMHKMQAHLETEKPLREMVIDDADRKLIQGYQFLTIKPLIVGINFGEDSKDKTGAVVDAIRKALAHKNLIIFPFFAKFENELAQLDEEEAAVFKEDFGITESALDQILRTSYALLGLHSFFTVGEDECRAWTIKINDNAQEAAGAIHSDFYQKFIRAEVVHYTDFLTAGSFAKCKEAGTWRLEGKEYIVKDGDILNIRHS